MRPGGATHTVPNPPNTRTPPANSAGQDNERRDGEGTTKGRRGTERAAERDGHGSEEKRRGAERKRKDGQESRHASDISAVRLRRECAPGTRPNHTRRALKCHGRSPDTPRPAGSIFSQIGVTQTASNTLRTGSARRHPVAQSGRRSTPPGPFRHPRGCRRRCPPAHWIQYSGPTHATTMEPLPRWPEKSARTGARPHSGSTSQQPVSEPHFSTDHNPANRNNAP
jgi:hypothetical protein